MITISNEIILAAADKEIIGKHLRERNLHLDVREEFYGSSPVSKTLFLETMSICTIANLVGNYTVKTAIEAKFIEPINVIEIEHIKHCQYAKMIRP